MHKCPKCNETWTIHKDGLLPGYLERLNIKTQAWYQTNELPLEDQEDCPACESGGQWVFCSVPLKYVVSAYHAAAFKSGRPCIPARSIVSRLVRRREGWRRYTIIKCLDQRLDQC